MTAPNHAAGGGARHVPPRRVPPHGTVNRYNHHACRCRRCRAATREARYRRGEVERPTDAVVTWDAELATALGWPQPARLAFHDIEAIVAERVVRLGVRAMA